MDKLIELLKDPKARMFLGDLIMSTPLAMKDPRMALAQALVKAIMESVKEQENDNGNVSKT